MNRDAAEELRFWKITALALFAAIGWIWLINVSMDHVMIERQVIRTGGHYNPTTAALECVSVAQSQPSQ